MSVKKLKVMHVDATGKKTNSELFTTSLSVNMSKLVATEVDTWARGFVGLTTDTYTDSEISETSSINEIIAE